MKFAMGGKLELIVLFFYLQYARKTSYNCFIYLIGELGDFYRLAPIAVIGGSFSLGSAGHNISEAAAAGCAVLTGHFFIGSVLHALSTILSRFHGIWLFSF